MLHKNKLAGKMVEVEHYSDFFNTDVNQILKKLTNDIFIYDAHIIKVKVTGADTYYQTLNYDKIQNFVDVLTQTVRDDVARNIEKGVQLFMLSLQKNWTDSSDSINDSE